MKEFIKRMIRVSEINQTIITFIININLTKI